MGWSSLHTKVFFWGPCQSLKVSSKSNSPEKSFTSYGGLEKQKKTSPRRIKGARARGWVLYEAALRAAIKCWWPRRERWSLRSGRPRSLRSRIHWAHPCSLRSHKTEKMAVGMLMEWCSLHSKVFFWGACQSLKVWLKSNSPEKSFTSYGRGSLSWGADVQRQKNGTRNVDGTKFAAHQSVLLGCLSIPESFVKME